MVKNLPVVQGIWFHPCIRKIAWRMEWLPVPTFLPGEFHGQRNLVDYSPWRHRESDKTEQKREAKAILFRDSYTKRANHY